MVLNLVAPRDDRGDGARGRRIGSDEGVLTPTERRLTSEAAHETTEPQKQYASQRSEHKKRKSAEKRARMCPRKWTHRSQEAERDSVQPAHRKADRGFGAQQKD